MLSKTQLFFAGALFCAGYFVQTNVAHAGFEWHAPVKKAPAVAEKVETEGGDWMTPIEWAEGTPEQGVARVQNDTPEDQNKVQAVEAEALVEDSLAGAIKDETAMSEAPVVNSNAPQTITKKKQCDKSLKTRASSETEIMNEALQADKDTQKDDFFHVNNAMKSSPAIDIAEGFGQDVSLVMAVRQITPARYQFIFDGNVDLGQSVDWQGGSAWTEVLGAVLSPLELSFSVNENIVTIGRTMMKPVSVKNVAPKSVETVEEAADSSVVKIENAWSAKTGDMLHDVLKKWAARSGTELYWSIDYDYEINQDVVLSGDYEGAVEQLLEYFDEVTPRPYGQLHVSSRGPKVLIIKAYNAVN